VFTAWEAWESKGFGAWVHFRFSAILNRKSEYFGKDIEPALDYFGSHQNEEWVSLDKFVEARLAGMMAFIQMMMANAANDSGQRHAQPEPPNPPQ
jgi:hypothetical protein